MSDAPLTLTKLETLDCLGFILKPVIAFCVRHSISIQEITELAKASMVDVCAEDYKRRGQRVNVSALCASTGIRRREIARLRMHRKKKVISGSLLTRVVGRWLTMAQYVDSNGEPRVLGFNGNKSEFALLVHGATKDLGYKAVLSELLRNNIVEVTESGLKLCKRAYEPRGDDVKQGFALLGQDLADLICAVEENIFESAEPRNLHATTEFDNIALEQLEAVREWLLQQGASLHDMARAYLARIDRDTNPGLREGESVRVVLGTFGRVVRSNEKKSKR